MMYSKRHLPDRAVEPSSGSNVIPRRARPGLAGLRPHAVKYSREGWLAAVERRGHNLTGVYGLSPESQGQNLDLTVLCVQYARQRCVQISI